MQKKIVLNISKFIYVLNFQNQLAGDIISKFVFFCRWSEDHIIFADQFHELVRWHLHGDTPLRLYYFTITTFREYTTWIANCPPPGSFLLTLLLPPKFYKLTFSKIFSQIKIFFLQMFIKELKIGIHGGWSEWSDFACNVPCGGGFGIRKRLCNNPEPNLVGNACEGPSSIDSECNQFECGCFNPSQSSLFYFEFSEVQNSQLTNPYFSCSGTIEKAEELLHKKNYSISAKENTEVILECEMSIVLEARNDSPGSSLQWLKEGFRIPKTKLKLEKVDQENSKLSEPFFFVVSYL